MPASRVDKYKKQRRNTKRISRLLVLASILVVVFLGWLMFGGGSKADEPNESQHDNGNTAEHETEKESDDADGKSSSETDDDDGDDEDDEKIEELESSDDNVRKAYTADWDPVGTKQSEPHTINYDEDSQDRQEMRTAIATATDLDEHEFTIWWIEQKDEQQVITTVSDPEETTIYRVYNKWVANEGWQPTKVEQLKENDQKWRFE